jgi:hypothetical protein
MTCKTCSGSGIVQGSAAGWGLCPECTPQEWRREDSMLSKKRLMRLLLESITRLSAKEGGTNEET